MSREQINVYYPGVTGDQTEFFASLIDCSERLLAGIDMAVLSEEELNSASLDSPNLAGMKIHKAVVVPALRLTPTHDQRTTLAQANSGKPGRLNFTYGRLLANKKKPRGQNSGLPWGREGLKEYLSTHFPITTLTFAKAHLMRTGSCDPDRRERSLLLELDPDAQTTQMFNQAQSICIGALNTMVSSRERLTAYQTRNVAKVDLANTRQERVNEFLADVNMRLPVTLEIGRVVISHETL